MRERRPDWELVAIAPDFAADDLRRSFDAVAELRSGPGEGRQGSPASVALTWLRRLRQVTAVLRSVDADLVHSTGDFFVDVLPVAAVRRAGAPRWSGVVHHINAPPWRRKNDALIASVSFLLQRASFGALRAADSVSVLNSGVRDDLAALGFRGERILQVGAGIDTGRFSCVPVARRERRVLWLHRLEPTKGLADLPEIARRLPPGVAIDVVGRGPEVHVSALRRELERAGASDRCVLHGFVDDAGLREIIARAAVFISCSYEEGWGISIAEALAMGLPCVAYDLPSHREIFGDAIERVPLGDAAAFAATLCRLVDAPDSDDRRAERHAFAQTFSLDACARRQETAFDALFGGSAALPSIDTAPAPAEAAAP